MLCSLFLFLLVSASSAILFEKGEFVGCYKDTASGNINLTQGNGNAVFCIDTCLSKYYRYSYVHLDSNCVCNNYIEDQKDLTLCKEFLLKDANYTTEKQQLADVYATGVTANGPPRNLQVENITNSSAHITWEIPESYIEIDHYKVEADIVNTFSQIKLVNLKWKLPTNSYQFEMISLHPGTLYNISVAAVDQAGLGTAAVLRFTTLIGEPDERPLEPEILDQDDRTMTIKIKPVNNNNGPVTSYLVVVCNADSVQAVQVDNLKPYNQADAEGYTYYITAEVQPQIINQPFTIGDGKIYGKYYNAPLQKDGSYNIMIGVVSRSNTIEKTLFSATTNTNNDVIVLEMNNEDQADAPVLIIILSIAIVIISCLLIAGLIGFYILRNHVHHRHRQRLNDNQELTLQGPMINVENNGYIPEDEPGNSNHYENLNEQIWIIPRNLLNIEHTILLGIGKFGRVHSGTVLKDESLQPVGVYSIADRKLKPEDKKIMLKDLDVLIKAKRHPNVLELIGTCESMDTVCVVLEYSSTNLKELLLNSRVFSANRFSNLSESQAVDFAIDICKGMEYLHSKKILHKALCPVHTAIVNGSSAKISGFGLTKYYKTESVPDVVRYAAHELFRGQNHSTKSDVWSFACILWEICALGATPYGNISSNDIAEKVVRGLRLAQLPYINDSLYQIMLNCWQLDMDERPHFSVLLESLVQVKEDQYLSFSIYQGFQYEPYYLELEQSKDSVY